MQKDSGYYFDDALSVFIKKIIGVFLLLLSVVIFYYSFFSENYPFVSFKLFNVAIDFLGAGFLYIILLLVSFGLMLLGRHTKYQQYFIVCSVLVGFSTFMLLGGIVSSFFNYEILLSGVAGFATEKYLFSFFHLSNNLLIFVKILLVLMLLPTSLFFLLVGLNLNFENILSFSAFVGMFFRRLSNLIKMPLVFLLQSDKSVSKSSPIRKKTSAISSILTSKKLPVKPQ
ncbi:MAG: hypothetical protein LBU68_02320, partial [Rickettsiales bacterium]|nr:hypothetical protein [Rickettsiales bacterium]